MSRLRQRLHHRYSDTTSPGSIRRREAIDNINIDPSQITSLADLNTRGLWQANGGVTTMNQAFTAANCKIDRNGYLVINQQGAAWNFGEWYNNIPTDYPVSCLASRILRSEIMLEYQVLGGIVDTAISFNLMPYSPAAGILAGALSFVVACGVGPGTLLSEATIAPGGVGAAFVSERDALSNKIRISAQRVNANSKNFVCTWYNRTAVATATATVNWAGAGLGDTPLMWRIQFNAGGALPNSQLMIVKSLQISDDAITYGNVPV